MIDEAHQSFRHIVDIGEVALHPALVEELDRTALDDRAGEDEHRHIGPIPRTVDRKEPQAGTGNAVEMAIGMGHQFVRLLARRIKADRMVDVVMHRERQFGVGAIDRGR
jgi:hypothetical protein